MKIIALAIVTLVTSSAIAWSPDTSLFLNLFCSDTADQRAPMLSLRLRKLHNLPLNKQQELKKYPYQLEITRMMGPAVLVQPAVYKGTMEFEDVVTLFNSDDGKAHLTFYADELDQTHLRVGNKTRTLDCRYSKR